MKNRYAYLILFVGIWCCSFSAFSQESEYVPGKLYLKIYNRIVRELPDMELGSQASLEEVFPSFTQLAQKYKFTQVRRAFQTRDINLDHTYMVEFDSRVDVKGLQAELQGLPFVEYSEQVPMVQSFFLPNDWSQFDDLWHLEVINAQAAWDITKGSEDVVIAIVDDAVMVDHEDLEGNVWINPGEVPNNGVDDDGNGYIDDVNGFNVAGLNPNPRPPRDDFAHGTHVAGCAAAATDNETGIPAIGFNCKIMAVRSSSNASNGGGITNAYDGVDYAIAAGADIINMSWGGRVSSQVHQNLIEAAHRRGIILVAAAGNDNSETLQYPAAYNHVIAVGATNRNDARSGFSNFGGWVDIMAPGSDILSTIPEGNTGGYGTQNGTSMASPIVAGLLGLMKSINPCLSPEEAERILETTAENIDDQNPNFIGKLGSGRIDAAAAVEAAFNAEGSGTPPPPVANFTFDNSSECSNKIPFTYISDGNGATCAFSLSYRWTVQGTDNFEWVSNEQNPFIEFPVSGTYSVFLEVSNAGGRALAEETIEIEVNPNAFIDAGEDIIVCQGDSIQLNGSTSADIQSITWSPNTDLVSPDSLNPIFPALRAGGNFVLRVEGADGCMLEDSLQVDVFRNPIVRTLPAADTMIQQGDTLQLGVAEGSGAFAFEWNPPDGLDNPNISNPKAYPDTTTTYTVLGIGEGGCVSSAELTVVVAEPVSNSPLLPDGGRILSAFPNPMSQQLTLEADLVQAGFLSIELVDMLGRTQGFILQRKTSPGRFEFTWNRPATLANGVYLLRWNFNEHLYTQRIQIR